MSKRAESVFETSAEGPLWPEWTDASLNKENWAIPKNGPDGLFRDTQLVRLPPSLEPSDWIRAKDLPNLSEPLTLYVTDIGQPDFVTANKHLLHSEFARWFISALINLQYCGRDGLEISGESGNFFWNGRDQPWQGWMNVYSMNKAGKGVQHRPALNPNGKYIVRLYFLGAWRRILVDDMIPVNADMLPLLPRASNDFELWPMILAKALLKMASLTWTGCREIVDFHPVACLTGWVCVQLHVGYMSPQDKWDFLRKYADHFEWQVEAGPESQEIVRSKKSKEVKTSKETVQTRKSKDTDRTSVTRTKDDVATKLKALPKPQPITLFLGLEDMKEVPSEDVPDIAPCWGHFVHVAQSRDIPLDPKDVKPPLARWKLYRWLKWAIQEGIIDPVEYFTPIRSLKVVSPLKHCEESVINKFSAVKEETYVQNLNVDNKTKMEAQSKDRAKIVVPERVSVDISFWADFNNIEPFVKDIHFFYKLDYFPYTAKLSDRFSSKQQAEQKSDSKKESKKGSRKSSPARATFKDQEFIDTFGWPQELSKTRNEPLYIFVDSLEPKFFLINFSTFQVSADTPPNRTETSNSYVAFKGSHDCLSIERHNWFRRPEKSCCLISILTAGTKSNVLEIDRGRHLLRVYCHSQANCFTTISSDTAFHLGDKGRMYQLMCTESETIDYISKYISNSISNAYQAFGTERFTEALSVYYKSYLPSDMEMTRDSKQLCNQIHDYFIDEQVQLLRKLVPENEVSAMLRSLRVFFLNPTIGLECFNATSMFLKSLREPDLSTKSDNVMHGRSNSSQSSSSTLLSEDQAAVIVQAFFQMITIRKYRKIHDPNHQHHAKVSDALLKIADMFNYNKRESLANQLLRNILKHHDKLYDVYFWSKDFEYTLQAQELKGTLLNVKSNQWLPITRLVVNPQATETVLAAIDLFVTLPKYSVRVFNNETYKEMFRLINNVAATRYTHTKLGYTIFCYGWSEDQSFKELPYALNIVTMKGQPMFHFLDNETPLPSIPMAPSLVTQELSNTYIPNWRHFVSKWIVRVTKTCIVSFRLRTSYENVRMRFTVTDDENHVLAQVKGVSVVILPMVYLAFVKKPEAPLPPRARNSADGDNSSNSGNNSQDENSGEEKVDADGDRSNEDLEDRVTYHVQASILDDSWPLTKTEWGLVSEFEVKPTGSLIKMKLPVSSSSTKLSKTESLKSVRTARKSSKQSVDSGPLLESPYWVLQVVTDLDCGLEIFQDRSKEMEIAKMKETWAEENPDSLQRGKELREAFVKKHEIRTKSSSSFSMEGKPSNLSMRSSSRRLSRRSSTVDASVDTATVEERTLKAPPSLRRLPPLDLSVYEDKEDININDMPYVRTDSAADILADMDTLRIAQSKASYANFLKELRDLMDKQKDRHVTLYGNYQDNFMDRRVDLEEAYEGRNAYINSMRSAAASSIKTSVNKKSKASKKN